MLQKSLAWFLCMLGVGDFKVSNMMRTKSQERRNEKLWCHYTAFPEIEVVESWVNRGKIRARDLAGKKSWHVLLLLCEEPKEDFSWDSTKMRRSLNCTLPKFRLIMGLAKSNPSISSLYFISVLISLMPLEHMVHR